MTRFCQYPLCPHPDQPLTAHQRKYHTECNNMAKRERDKGRDWKKYRKEKKEVELCTCCGRRPRGRGLKFLCNLCYEYDGPDWVEYYRPGNAEARRNTELVV